MLKNWLLRFSLLLINCLMMGFLLPYSFVWYYQLLKRQQQTTLVSLGLAFYKGIVMAAPNLAYGSFLVIIPFILSAENLLWALSKPYVFLLFIYITCLGPTDSLIDTHPFAALIEAPTNFDSNPNQRLKNQITSAMHQYEKLHFLKKEEIEKYKQAIDETNITPSAKEEKLHRLADYIAYVSQKCCFTLNDISELAKPITLSGSAVNLGNSYEAARYWEKTYEYNELLNWIDACTINEKNVTEPETRDNLTHAYITIIPGIPLRWKYFIDDIREFLIKSAPVKPKQAIESSAEMIRNKRLIYFSIPSLFSPKPITDDSEKESSPIPQPAYK